MPTPCYRGKMDHTRDGLPGNRTCISWNKAMQTGHRTWHLGTEHHNYCRNPDNDRRGPWCYTALKVDGKRTRYGYCTIAKCDTPQFISLAPNGTTTSPTAATHLEPIVTVTATTRPATTKTSSLTGTCCKK